MRSVSKAEWTASVPELDFSMSAPQISTAEKGSGIPKRRFTGARRTMQQDQPVPRHAHEIDLPIREQNCMSLALASLSLSLSLKKIKHQLMLEMKCSSFVLMSGSNTRLSLSLNNAFLHATYSAEITYNSHSPSNVFDGNIVTLLLGCPSWSSSSLPCDAPKDGTTSGCSL